MKSKAITTMILFLASIFTLAFNVAPVAATPDNVGLWHLDEGIGSTAADSSGYTNDGTLSGGKFGNALEFDGVDDYVEVDVFRCISGGGGYNLTEVGKREVLACS